MVTEYLTRPVCTKGSQDRKAGMKFKLVLSGLENSELFFLPRRVQTTGNLSCLLLKSKVQKAYSPSTPHTQI